MDQEKSRTGTALLEVRHLNKWFSQKQSLFSFKKRYIKAVNDVSFVLNAGETLGIVGESGCGKSTMGRAVLRLIEPTAGEILYKGTDLLHVADAELRKIRANMQIIFQDPYASLNPRMTVGEIIAEPLEIQKHMNIAEIRQRILETMKLVGLDIKYYNRYPHEFSGGQRQRICIARAIVLRPEIVVCDEPVSALDVSIQAQVVNLLKELQEKLGMAYIFISHDLSVIRHISDRIIVMYLGHIVEVSEKEELYHNPLHPYTRALLSAIPVIGTKGKKNRILLEGDLPSPADPPGGCVFHTRCYMAKPVCSEKIPELKDCGSGHCCACHFSPELPV
jgi:oligopeptide/dipeptide ABC transporter ATP-binding protein